MKYVLWLAPVIIFIVTGTLVVLALSMIMPHVDPAFIAPIFLLAVVIVARVMKKVQTW